MNKPGMPPPGITSLLRVEDRMTFLYLERCVVHRDANAITATDDRGTVHIPAAAIGALIFGPGVSVSHQAMLLLGESGSTAIWAGEQGVRYYAHGRPLARSAKLLMAQAELVSNQSSRLRVARQMYAMRFPDEDTTRLTMQQLRGREGARVRRAYRQAAEDYAVAWKGRDFNPNDFDAGDAINQALSAATACLYGIAHSVIVALGCSPGLGFVHTGHVRSFVYDIADLYKVQFAIPTAFEIAAGDFADVGSDTRRAMRDRFHNEHLLETCSRDIRTLLGHDDGTGLGETPDETDEVALWDVGARTVPGGTNYEVFDW